MTLYKNNQLLGQVNAAQVIQWDLIESLPTTMVWKRILQRAGPCEFIQQIERHPGSRASKAKVSLNMNIYIYIHIHIYIYNIYIIYIIYNILYIIYIYIIYIIIYIHIYILYVYYIYIYYINQFRLTFEGYKISIPFPSPQKHLRPHRPQVQMAGYSGEIVLENSRKALENLLLQWWHLMRFWLVLPGTLADISMHSTQARKQPIVFKCLHRKSVTRHDGTGIRSFMKFIV